jgi:hypothetical protein
MRQIAGANENGPDIGRTRVMGAEGFEPGAARNVKSKDTAPCVRPCALVCVPTLQELCMHIQLH